MIFSLTRSIHTKLVLTVGVAVVCGVLLTSLSSAWRETHRRFDAKKEEIAGVAAVLAASVARGLATGDRAYVAKAVNAIGQIPAIKFAHVHNNANTLTYQTGTGIIVSRKIGLGNEAELNPLSSIYLGSHRHRMAIRYAGRQVGYLQLIADLSSLRTALKESVTQALISGLLAGILGMIASLYFQNRIVEPISELTRTMQTVRQEYDFSRTVKRMSDDETGQLVDAFNNMLEEIRTRDDKLTRHRETLEVRVEERTAELVTARHQAEAANAAKSEFLATMSHEVRTPMSGMLVMAELLSASGLSPRLQRNADIIVSSGQSLLAIINDILDLSKIEAGKLDLETVAVEPSAIVDNSLQLFSERAMSKNIDLSAYSAPNVPSKISGDPVRLGQILTNLINNALKFTDAGHVLVRLETAERAARGQGNRMQTHLVCSVTDTGIGIPEDKLATIFDSFAQADKSTTRSFGGTGIGLTICRKLVTQMGGELIVESVVGTGTTFTFDIPVDVLEAASAETASPRQIELAATPSTIALALPESATRNTLAEFARDAGFDVICANSMQSIADLPTTTQAIFSDAATAKLIAEAIPGEQSMAIVALAQMGEETIQQLINQGEVDIELSKPVCVRDIQPLLASLAAGPESWKSFVTQENSTNLVRNATSFAGVRVLAADDSAVNREVLVEALSRLDVEAVCVNDGAEAVEAVQNDKFDLVFMDGSMPVMDGFEAAVKIRELEAAGGWERTPIVALTAHVVGTHATAWKDAGMDACVTKPFKLKTIEETLQSILGDGAKGQSSMVTAVNNTETEEQPGPVDENVDADLDESVLESVLDFQRPGDDLIGRIVGLYCQHAPDALEKLLSLAPDGSDAEVAAAAHALKSLSRNVGALRIGNLCDVVEIAARDGKAEISKTTAEQLTTALNGAILALQDWNNKVSARPSPAAEALAG